MKTISLLNLKGGVAKTTTGGNIAKGLANRGFKTLLKINARKRIIKVLQN